MAFGLTDIGEEALTKHWFEESITKPASMTVGLYNDGTDGLADSDDLADITTEPGGASYARQTATFGTTDWTAEDNASGNWQAILANQTWDVSDSSQSVDAYFFVINYTSSDAGDSGATDHVFARFSLGGTTNLSNYSGNITYSDLGMEID